MELYANALKIRVDVTHNADCSGGTQKELQAAHFDRFPYVDMASATATLSGTTPNFSLSELPVH
jgi:hypothetical protein